MNNKKRITVRITQSLYDRLKAYQEARPHLSFNAAVNELLLIAIGSKNANT